MIDRADPRSRSDAYGRRINRDHSPILAYAIPWATVLLASIAPTLAIAAAAPLMPPLGLLFLVSWRLSRPGLFPVWAGFPLGAFDDLFSGQPFGSAIFLWSVAMLVIEALETRFPWRSFVQDWLIAAGVVAGYVALGAALSGAAFSLPLFVALVPQIILSLMLFPFIAMLVSALDRIRLTRFRTLR